MDEVGDNTNFRQGTTPTSGRRQHQLPDVGSSNFRKGFCHS